MWGIIRDREERGIHVVFDTVCVRVFQAYMEEITCVLSNLAKDRAVSGHFQALGGTSSGTPEGSEFFIQIFQ